MGRKQKIVAFLKRRAFTEGWNWADFALTFWLLLVCNFFGWAGQLLICLAYFTALMFYFIAVTWRVSGKQRADAWHQVATRLRDQLLEYMAVINKATEISEKLTAQPKKEEKPYTH